MLDTTEPVELFDPRNYAGVRRPYYSAETLPAWCYTSERFHARERERIFMKYWNCIGHNSRAAGGGELHHAAILWRAPDRGGAGRICRSVPSSIPAATAGPRS